MAAAASRMRSSSAMSAWAASAVLLLLLLLPLVLVDAQPAVRTGVEAKLAVKAAAAKPPMSETLGNITLPPGFAVELYARVGSARALFTEKRGAHTITYVGGAGGSSSVSAVVDKNSDNVVDNVTVLLSGLNEPHGVAVSGNYLYFAHIFNSTMGQIWRVKNAHLYALNNTAIPASARELVTDKLPGGSSSTGHKRRMIRFTKDPSVFVVHLGVNCNSCNRPDPASGGLYYTGLYAVNVSTVNATAGTQATLRLIAVGMRNAQGADWHPTTGDLYLSEANRDSMGNNRPDCEVNRVAVSAITSGGNTPATVPFYGFARCYSSWEDTTPYQRPPGPGADVVDPDYNARGAALNCSGNGFYRPVQGLGPHTTPIGVRFYRWQNKAGYYPKAQYRNALLVAEHGSWNRYIGRIGARVMRLTVDAATGRALNYTEFMGGFITNPTSTVSSQQSYRGRPVDVSQLTDGSVLVSDDYNNVIYRVKYTG